MTNPEKYLVPQDDGLAYRESQDYARYKLKALETYIDITNTAMRNSKWRARFYIDLQAGPGKNRIGNSIVLGSPLIALTAKHPFTQYRFNELDRKSQETLEKRVNESPRKNSVKIYQDDANVIVNKICEEIEAVDRQRLKDLWSTLNVAFLDPEGLELHWSTVARLAKINKMDLIINFSTSGIIRNIGANQYEPIDRFFGNQDWRQFANIGDSTLRRRKLIDLYRSQLAKFGYYTDEDPDLGSHDITIKNSRNTEVYSLIFASKNELGDKFWRVSTTKPEQPRLF